jgi:hypothetical protein
MAVQQSDNQKLQNMANQRSEELKTSTRVTGAGETSSQGSATSTNVDGRVNPDDRDVETFAQDARNSGASTGDNSDSRNH